MDSRTLVNQMQQLGVWPDDGTAQRAILDLCQRHSTDVRRFARELLQRDWVTAYQVNALFAGKGNQLVLGPYVVQERLGEGGMGQVFKARHRHQHHIVALKVIRPERVANPIAVSRYHREVQAAQQMNHPNIVPQLESDQSNGIYYLAMEFIKGVDLLSFVKHRGPLPVSQACQFLAEAAQGLQHIHEHGLVHRDIKPGNLFLEEVNSGIQEAASDKPTTVLQMRRPCASRTARYQIRIVDLGLARLCEQNARAEGGQLDLTQIGAVVGTADYMAPEQARDSREADIRSDIYALGCTFYFALGGQVPFPGGTPIDKMLRHQLDEPAPIEKFRPDLPPALAAVLRRMMARQPAERLQTPAEVAVAVAPWCGDDGAPPMAIPMETAEQPTLSDFAGLTDEPGLVVDPRAVPKRKFNLGWLVSMVVLFAAFAGVAILLFSVLVRSMASGEQVEPQRSQRTQRGAEMGFQPIPEEDERIAHDVIGAAIEVHRLLGPGFLEKIYERALIHELELRSLSVQPQQEILVPYKGIGIPGQKLDLLVAGRVIVELKTVDQLHPIHEAQLLSYLKATGLRVGLLMNFNVKMMKDGIKRLVR